MDISLKFLLEHWPSAAWIIVGGFIVYFYFRIKISSDEAKRTAGEAISKINELPCNSHSELFVSQKEHLRDMDLKIEKLNVNMMYTNKLITDMLKVLNALSEKMNVNIITSPTFTQSSSPLALTESGKEKVMQLGIDRMIDLNWKRISDLITGNVKSTNPYDIQQFILDETMLFPEKFISAEDIEHIKTDAYITGEILQSYMRIVAIMVRDRYFSEHHISAGETDKYTPTSPERMK
jgi:hypothetical protein